jgi:hypothetical protein
MCVRARRSQSSERPAGNTTSPALAFRLGADEIDGSCEATALDGRGGHERPAGKLTRLPNFEDRRYEFGKRGKAKWPPGIVAPNPLRDEMSSNFVNALLARNRDVVTPSPSIAEAPADGVSPIRGDWPWTAPTAGSPWIGRPTDAEFLALNSVWMTASRGSAKDRPVARHWHATLSAYPFRCRSVVYPGRRPKRPSRRRLSSLVDVGGHVLVKPSYLVQ